MFGMGWFGGEMGAAGWVLMALTWGAFLAVVVWAVLRMFPPDRRDRGDPQLPDGAVPTDVDRRLAAGEIDAGTYLRQGDSLTGTY
jgi:putative membrane protein